MSRHRIQRASAAETWYRSASAVATAGACTTRRTACSASSRSFSASITPYPARYPGWFPPVRALCGAITFITTRTAGGSAGSACAHSGRPHRQTKARFSDMASTASARRWPSVRGSSAHTPLASCVTRWSKLEPAFAVNVPSSRAVPSGPGRTRTSRRRSAFSRSRMASGSISRTAASTALMTRCRDHDFQPEIRPAKSASRRVMIPLSVTSSVRSMITATVAQSICPRRRTCATWGSRSVNASACETTSVATLGEMFMAAPTSATVRENPVTNM